MKSLYINDKHSKRRHTGRRSGTIGVIALITGILVMVIFACLIPMSVSKDKSVQSQVAGLAFLDMLLSMCGMAISAKAVKERAEHYGMALAGIIINSLMFIIMVSMFFIGLE